VDDTLLGVRVSGSYLELSPVYNGVAPVAQQGDYIALQLRDNRMLLNIDLGMHITSVIIAVIIYS
jgi:hypothetical protein